MNVPSSLRRRLGLSAVMAVVMGDMLGSGIFFTPGELASLAEQPWQVYFIWGASGLIVLCGALTLGELISLLPKAGASFHIIKAGFGPFWGFVKVWMEVWVTLPGSVAGVAIVFGDFAIRFMGDRAVGNATSWGIAAIAVFAAINLLGVQWGGRTQIALTATKIVGLLLLVLGSFLLAEPVPVPAAPAMKSGIGLLAFLRFIGLGIAAVLFTYDGWTDVSHVAGEVVEPQKNLPRGLALGVGGITLLYLLVNMAYLRVVPLEAMQSESTTVATTVAMHAFGPIGGSLVNGLIMLSIFGALGGLVMTAPRLVYAGAAQYGQDTRGRRGNTIFQGLSFVSRRTSVPTAAIGFSAALAMVALIFFGTFGRLVNYIIVPLQLTNILMVASIFRLRRRSDEATNGYRTPGYPWVPLIFIVAMSFLVVSAIYYNPLDTLIGVAITAAGIPVYLWIAKGRMNRTEEDR
jgi:APA family basic amino acid/polyamine antiporter